jgi:NAD(P)H-dependent flavin oxidoreductase YrpB (nitropropane dioxygenase family)
MPPLTIGGVTAPVPIIQGGMAVRISLAPLAVAVADAGGIGVIAGSGLPAAELRRELRSAREATDGVLGVNIMVAITEFRELVEVVLEEGADLLLAGAGFSRDVFRWCAEAGVAFVPIVGSARAAGLSQRFGADAVVVEGVEAGGHLGTDRSVAELLPEVLDAVDIPVVAAGGICDGHDIRRFLDAGAAGVQMGSRFAATVESSAPQAFKQMYVAATADDVLLINSPVGLPGRALRNPFAELLQTEDESLRIARCIQCLKVCHRDYCIIERLEQAQSGDVRDGLVFAGESVVRIDDIPTVADLIDRLQDEWAQAGESGAA